MMSFHKILTVIYVLPHWYCYKQCEHFYNKTTSLFFLIVLNDKVANTKGLGLGFSLI